MIPRCWRIIITLLRNGREKLLNCPRMQKDLKGGGEVLCRKGGNSEKNRNFGVSGARQNHGQVGPFTFNSINCKGWRMELEECRVLCEWRMANHCVHKRLKEIVCALNKPKGQNYRFIHTESSSNS